jgi:hypothetical protein
VIWIDIRLVPSPLCAGSHPLTLHCCDRSGNVASQA